MAKPRVIVFATGTEGSGGSGAENLVLCARDPEHELEAEIVAFVSNHENGGVRKRAEALGIPFIHFSGPNEAKQYEDIVEKTGAEWVLLSGWLLLAKGLDPRSSVNIHPGPLSVLGEDGEPKYGGKGMYGIHVSEAVLADFQTDDNVTSAVSMHFVTPKFDDGPLFFEAPVPIYKDDTVDTLQARVNKYEHKWQPIITQKVIDRQIYWDGKEKNSLVLPDGYQW